MGKALFLSNIVSLPFPISPDKSKEINMKTITEPLRDEHKELLPHIESLRIAGESIHAHLFSPFIREEVEKAYKFLTDELIPHAKAEDRALYPVVQKVMGAKEATATMSRDHVEVDRLTGELGDLLLKVDGTAITDEQTHAMRRILFGLYALVKVHFAKEEEVYLPLLDARLTEQEAAAMFESMERAAHDVKSKL
jgi:iron-sulfur cluster repair protein YtfE (RIC family)